MRYTIITVVLNGLEQLKFTMDGVLKQKFTDYEYVIIDGGSQDGTVEFLEDMTMKDSRIRYISEKDTGIYNAMNKGLRLAQGDYVMFLGAGDVFCDEHTLETVAQYLKYDVIYGRIIYSSGPFEGQIGGDKMNRKTFLLDGHVAHQSVYVKTSVMKKYGFQEKYKIEADQDAMMRMYKDKCSVKYIKQPLCYYDGLGVSIDSMMNEQNILDRVSMLKEHFPVLYAIRTVGHWIKTGKTFNLTKHQ